MAFYHFSESKPMSSINYKRCRVFTNDVRARMLLQTKACYSFTYILTYIGLSYINRSLMPNFQKLKKFVAQNAVRHCHVARTSSNVAFSQSQEIHSLKNVCMLACAAWWLVHSHFHVFFPICCNNYHITQQTASEASNVLRQTFGLACWARWWLMMSL